MFLIKLATLVAFFVALLVICILIKAIANSQKQHATLVRKNETLHLELNAQENIKGLEADSKTILNN